MAKKKCTVGIIGLGAFGTFMGRHLAPHVRLCAYDISPKAKAAAKACGASFKPLAEVAACAIVILAVPVPAISKMAKKIAPYVKKGALVMDVGSVKIKPAQAMLKHLPKTVDIICTHPLFGPQSGSAGLKGLNITVCNVRGKRLPQIKKFLSSKLKLNVIEATAQAHDRELAAVQGLTHMIAKILVEMEPLPKKMTTRSFELIMRAIEMVRYDSEELFLAIEKQNPYSAKVRKRFFALAAKLDKRLHGKSK